MKNSILGLFVLLNCFVFGQTNVPNTATFTLQDVYNSVSSHAPSTTGDLVSCFNNSVSAYFDATYNNDGYAPANSMLRFRNYTPSPYWDSNVLYFSSTSTANTLSFVTRPVGQTLIILSIVTKNAARAGGTPTYGGNAMTTISSGNDIELFYANDATPGDKSIYIPNSTSDTIMYSHVTCRYYGNLAYNGSTYSSTQSQSMVSQIPISTGNNNLIISTSFAYSNNQPIQSGEISSIPAPLTTTASASLYQRMQTGAAVNYTGTNPYTASIECQISDVLSINLCCFYVY